MPASIAIPHGCPPRSDAAPHDSLRPAARVERARALATATLRLHELFGSDHPAARHAFGALLPAADPQRMELDVVVCVQEGAHLLDALPCPGGLFHRQPVTGDPQLPGFAAHRVLERERGRYAGYAYREDDIVVADPLFFRKLSFSERNFPLALDPAPLFPPSRYDSPEDGDPHRSPGGERV